MHLPQLLPSTHLLQLPPPSILLLPPHPSFPVLEYPWEAMDPITPYINCNTCTITSPLHPPLPLSQKKVLRVSKYTSPLQQFHMHKLLLKSVYREDLICCGFILSTKLLHLQQSYHHTPLYHPCLKGLVFSKLLKWHPKRAFLICPPSRIFPHRSML